MSVLITRPESEAQELATTLAASGWSTQIVPMLNVEFLPPPRLEPALPILALCFTSSNGVRAVQDLNLNPSTMVYTVGDATAHTAQNLGFQSVISVDGNGNDLWLQMARDLADKRANGQIVHFSGRHCAVDIIDQLKQAKFNAQRYIVYQAKAAEFLHEQTIIALANQTISHISFFSQRTAEIFIKLLLKQDIMTQCQTVTALCLSKNIAAALKPVTWKAIKIAERPCMQSFLQLLDVTPKDNM